MIERIRAAASRIAGLLRRRALDRRLTEEIDTHLAMLAEQYEEKGMDPREAREAAQREFGGIAPMQESYRDQLGMPRLEALIRDIRFAVRSLWRDRLLAAVCLLSLSLAIGAGTAIFSAFEAVVFRPLPFAEGGNLVLVFETSKTGRHLASLPNVEDWRERSSVFSGLSVLSVQTMALSGGGEAEHVRGGFVSPDFFRILKVDPAVGRLELGARTREAVISHRLWTRRYEGRADIAGSVVVLNGEEYSVTGVLRPEFVFPIDDIDVWVPAENYATSMALARDLRGFLALGRLREGMGLEGAEAGLRMVASGLELEFPKENGGYGVSLLRLRDFLSEGVRGTLSYMLGAVCIMLLVACANVGGLLAARATQRQRQFALQSALGASRTRILRQVLAEGLTIGAGGGILGVAAASATAALLPSLLPNGAMPAGPPQINGVVLAACAGVSLIAGLLAGIVPAMAFSRVTLGRALREGDDRATDGRSRRVREGFLVVQVAASMMFLVGSAALLTELQRLMSANLGIAESTGEVLTMEYRVNRAKFASRHEQWEFHRRVAEGAQALPGVQAAALARAVPYSGNGGSVGFQLPGEATGQSEVHQAVFNTVTARYFGVMGIPLLQGRSCEDHDRDGGPAVILVNDRLAAHLWPNGDALGQPLVVTEWATATVIGVVGGNRQNDMRREPPWQIYACYSQNPGTLAAIVMRTNGDLGPVAEAAKKLVWSIDGDQAVWKIRTMKSLIDVQTRDQRIVTALMSAFAFFAAALALAGVYGMASYDAARRIKEIGIRRALGAGHREILVHTIGRTFLLVAGGVLLGAMPAPALMKGYSEAAVSLTLMFLCGVLLAVAAACAAARPGLRALRTNPMEVLRHE